MLYVLGGAARTGKSIISRRLLAEKQIPYFPVDILITLIQEGAPSFDIKHGQPFIPKAKKLWPFVKPLAGHLLKAEPIYLIEGDGLLPKCVSELIQEYGREVKACFTGYANIDPKYKLKLIRKYPNERDEWTHELSDKRMLAIIKSIIKFSQYLEKECQKYNITYFDGSEDFLANIEAIVQYFSH